MAWISSVRLRDYIESLPEHRLEASDALPVLADDRVKRIAGLDTTRYFDNLSGPVFSYDTRFWSGGVMEVPQTGLIDYGDSFDLTITGDTSGSVTRQVAEVDLTPVGFDWQAMNGAPDSAAITVVVGLQGVATLASSVGQAEAIFEIDGDVHMKFRAWRYDDGSSGVSVLFEDGADTISIVTSTDLDDELWNSVVVMSLDLPTNSSTAIWVDSVQVPVSPTFGGGYDTGPPFPDHEDANAVIDAFNVYLGRDQPAKLSGRFEAGYVIALYRGSPTTLDLQILQEYYQLPFVGT